MDRVDKRYKRGVHANRNISFEAHSGEVLGILGPNGAGKTTLVRQITTELLPTSGQIRVFGVDAVADPIGVKNLMGIVPQEAQLFEMLTVRETLRIFAKLRGLSGREVNRRADEVISQLRLDAHRNVVNMKLSGGLKRRVMVGLAALAEPWLIVLDEPTTGTGPTVPARPLESGAGAQFRRGGYSDDHTLHGRSRGVVRQGGNNIQRTAAGA